MAIESIGTLVPTKIPGLSDQADIQVALRTYHYGSDTFNTAETVAANLINPSIAYTLNNLQTQITAITGGSAIQATSFNAKGDLLSASANDTLSVLSVGSNGKYLTANSATATGLEWTTPEVTLNNEATLTNKTLTSPIINLALNAQTGTAYTSVLADNGKIVEMNNSSANTFTIPLNSSVAYPIGAQINIVQIGTGATTVVVTAGVTLNCTPQVSTNAAKLRTQYSSCTLIKRAENTWIALGDLSA
jgi:hypothetical protein